MKGITLVALFAVGAFAIWKHHLQMSATHKMPAPGVPAGVSQYPAIPAPSLNQQILAAQITNPDAVSEVGFSGAFGPFENQPGDGESLY